MTSSRTSALFSHTGFGHAINLAHSQTNGVIQQYADSKVR
jgi:hypothetical protein